MPTSIIALAIGYFASTAVASALVGVAGAAIFAAVAGGLASMAFNAAFASKPNDQAAAQQQLANNLLTIKQPIAPRQYIYGRTRVGGVYTYMHITADGYFHIVITFAGHPCEEIEAIYFGDTLVPIDPTTHMSIAPDVTDPPTTSYATYARIFKSLGDEAGQPFPELVTDTAAEPAGVWTDAHRQSGCCKIYVRLTGPNVFPDGLPNITAIIKGKKVYDPRSATTVWTDTPSLCQADFLCDGPAGLDATYADEIDEAQLIAAANLDDETVVITAGTGSGYTSDAAGHAIGSTFIPLISGTGTILAGDNITFAGDSHVYGVAVGLTAPGEIQLQEGLQVALPAAATAVTIFTGSEKRYTLNGSFLVNTTPGDILGRMLTANNGKVRYLGGLFAIAPAGYVSPTITLTQDDCRAVPHIIPRLSATDVCNGVKGLYTSEPNLWQPTDFPPVVNDTYLAEDGGDRAWLEMTLPFTKSAATAQRIAKIELERRRQQITVEWKGKLTAYRLQAGNTVMLDFPMMGWSGKVFEVAQTSLVFEEADGGIALGADLVLRETDPSVFDWNFGEQTTVDPAPDSNLPDPFNITPPTDLVISDAPLVLEDGTVIPRIAISWTPSSYPYTTGWVVRWRIPGAPDWQTIVVTEPATILQPLSVGSGYDIQIFTMTAVGRSQVALVASGHTALGQDTVPNAPTSLTATGGMFEISLAWTLDLGSRRDIRHTEIWGSLTNDRATAYRLTCEPWPHVAYDHVGLSPGQTWHYWCRVEDTSGNDSAWYPSGATSGVTASPSTDPSALLAQLVNSVGMAQLGTDLAAPITLVIDPVNLAHPALDAFTQAQTAATAALQAVLNTNDLQTMVTREKWISDATVIVDPGTGKVTLIATASITTDVEAHLNAVDVTLSAQAGSITSNTSSISSQGTRLTTAETNITSLQGTVALTASTSYVDGSINSALGAIDPANVATASQLGAEGILNTLLDADAGRKAVQADAVHVAVAQIQLITHADAILSQSVALTVVAAQLATNVAAVITEATARADADSALASLITTVQAATVANTANITAEQTARTTAVSAEAAARVALDARVGAAESAITTEATTRSTWDSALAASTTALAARVTTAESAITTESSARVTADTANASNITTLFSSVATAQGTANTAVTNAASAQTTANTAVTNSSANASNITTLFSSVATAQGTANTAVTNAATAQTTANTAVSNAAAVASSASTLQARLDSGDFAAVKTFASASASTLIGVLATWGVQVQTMADGHRALAGLELTAGTDGESAVGILANKLVWYMPDGSGTPKQVLTSGNVNGVATWGFAGNQIIDGSIVALNMAANSITAANAAIADAAIATAKIIDGAITNAKIGSAAIQTANIVDANITTLKVAGNAITVPVSAYTDGSQSVNSIESIVQAVTITTSGNPVFVTGTFMGNGFSGASNINGRIRRDGTYLGWSGQFCTSGQNGSVAVSVVDTPSAGTHTYTLTCATGTNGGLCSGASLFALEAKR